MFVRVNVTVKTSCYFVMLQRSNPGQLH